MRSSETLNGCSFSRSRAIFFWVLASDFGSGRGSETELSDSVSASVSVVSDSELPASKLATTLLVTWDRCCDYLNIFAKKFSEKLAFFTLNKAKLCKILSITLVFGKNAIFFAENCRKSQKIVIITSTPGGRFYVTVSAGRGGSGQILGAWASYFGLRLLKA
jgi:hypothetical protein